MQIFIIHNGVKLGPYNSYKELEGKITSNTLIWHNEMKDWTKASKIPSLQKYIVKSDIKKKRNYLLIVILLTVISALIIFFIYQPRNNYAEELRKNYQGDIVWRGKDNIISEVVCNLTFKNIKVNNNMICFTAFFKILNTDKILISDGTMDVNLRTIQFSADEIKNIFGNAILEKVGSKNIVIKGLTKKWIFHNIKTK